MVTRPPAWSDEPAVPAGNRGRTIGGAGRTYVIAEAGSNHNRDLAVANELIDVAAEAGADAVKFQTYSGSRIYSRRAESKYLADFDADSPAELLESISLPRQWHGELCERARERGIDFFSSPFDHEAVDELAAVGVPLLKIASGEIVDLPLIRRAAATGIPLIISTGMATMAEIAEALEAADQSDASGVALMQCASVYPAEPDDQPPGHANPAGGFMSPPASRTTRGDRGARRGRGAGRGHDREAHHPRPRAARTGPLVRDRARRAGRDGERHPRRRGGAGRRAQGRPEPRRARRELHASRRSLIAARDLAAGTVLEADMVTVKRPGTGIAPKHLEWSSGAPCAATSRHDDVLQWDMFDC